MTSLRCSLEVVEAAVDSLVVGSQAVVEATKVSHFALVDYDILFIEFVVYLEIKVVFNILEGIFKETKSLKMFQISF